MPTVHPRDVSPPAHERYDTLVGIACDDAFRAHGFLTAGPTVTALVTDRDRNALIKRFSGGHLVYANLDAYTAKRLREALIQRDLTNAAETSRP